MNNLYKSMNLNIPIFIGIVLFMTNRLSVNGLILLSKKLKYKSSLKSNHISSSVESIDNNNISKKIDNNNANIPIKTNNNYYKNTLLVATTKDIASINLSNALTNSGYFKEINKEIWKTNGFTLWIQHESLLKLDNVHELFVKKFNLQESFDNIIFLSKHKAISGKPSLTVHPIGIPWQIDNEISGGIPGRCSPPHYLMSRLYSEMLKECKIRGLDSRYEVTMEATHHGPYVDLPTCFVEIGSSENDWAVPEAGVIWADILVKELGIVSQDAKDITVDENYKKLAVVMIGGGHYVPKLNDAARLGDRVYCGHAIATYALDGLFEEGQSRWKNVILEAINSTKIGIPFAEIICLVDKKAFKAQYKNAITQYLDSLDIKWTFHFSELKSKYDQLQLTSA